MKQSKVPQSEQMDRHKLVFGKVITLNGKPARVTGVANRFATVTDKETGLSAEWSWDGVRLIMLTKGGRFKS